jgi:hypothetical protein
MALGETIIQQGPSGFFEKPKTAFKTCLLACRRSRHGGLSALKGVLKLPLH